MNELAEDTLSERDLQVLKAAAEYGPWITFDKEHSEAARLLHVKGYLGKNIQES